jgi:sorting nexin-7/30/sorting nexin-8
MGSRSSSEYVPVSGRTIENLADIDAKYYITGPAFQESVIPETAEITLSDPELVKAGFLQSDYVAFYIMTHPNEWSVKRRFDDFVWLRNVLTTLHGGYLVPSLPKEVNAGGLNQELPKRKLFLQRFINSIIAIPMFRASVHVIAFLKEENPKAWQAEKSRAKKIKKPSDLSQIFSPTGQIPVNPDTPSLNFSHKVTEYLKQMEATQKRLKRITVSLQNHFRELSQEIMSVVGLINNMRDI